MKDDRSEINDLSSMHPKRVLAMAKEWTRIAKEVDRRQRDRIAPPIESITKLNFKKNIFNRS
jgi:hypothetical protein